MREKFRDITFRAKTLELIDTLNGVISDYQQQGYRLTLRQLYYQCVVRNLFPNAEKSYKNLGSVVSNARLAGLMDWDAIEDRGRRPRAALEFTGPADFMDSMIGHFRLPRWEGQENYVELHCEKEALAGVLQPIAREYHITLMVNKGYSSSSAMYETAKRLEYVARTRTPYLLYLGDLDPSGEDMVRDIDERLMTFGLRNLEVRKIAIDMDQVQKHKPPPNPAKLSDSRAQSYIKKYGMSSWEVDALPPVELGKIIRRELDSLVDREMMDQVIAREEEQMKQLQAAARSIAKEGT